MIGIISALGAALSWTYACSIWRAQTNLNKPIEINLLKNLFAFALFSPILIFFDYSPEFKYILILLLSGIIGIGLGDTFYLKSLQKIGTRKTLSVEALSPLLAAFLSGFINENLSLKSWIGIIIVSASLIKIIGQQNYLKDKNSKLVVSHVNSNNLIYSFLSVFCAVIAALLSRLVFLESNFTPIQTTEIRLLGAIIFLLLIGRFQINFFISDLGINQRSLFIFSVFLGTNIGILLQQIVFKTLPLGIGWTLLSTSPVISLFFTKKEEGKITRNIIYITFALIFGLSLIIM